MRRAMLSLAGRAAGRAAGNSLVNSRAVSVVPSLQLGAATRAWNGCGLLRARRAAEGGVGARAMSGDAATPQPEFDMDLLRALQIDHVEPSKIAAVLKLENMTLDQLKMLVDEGYHLPPGAKIMHLNPAEQAIMSRNATEWSPDLVHQLNPKRRFFPGQTYLPEELSPNYEIDYAKLRNAQKALGCPLGGKKGPKIDFCNISLLSRFVTEGGQIIPRRKTMVCAKKQRELKRMVKRARTMNLIPYKSKLLMFQKNENPFLDS